MKSKMNLLFENWIFSLRITCKYINSHYYISVIKSVVANLAVNFQVAKLTYHSSTSVKTRHGLSP